MKMRGIFLRAVLLGAGMCIALLSGELLLRAAFFRSMDFEMEFWKYARTIEVETANPSIGFVHRPEQHGVLMGVDLSTNRFGLRGLRQQSRKPQASFALR